MTDPYVVKSGDNLWTIAERYLKENKSIANPTGAQILAEEKRIGALNNIVNLHLIYAGQTIKFTADGSGNASAKVSNKVTINQFGIRSDNPRMLFATWTWTREHTAGYKVLWMYDTGNGVWFEGANNTNQVDKDAPELARQSTYTIPDGAKAVRFRVKPISETYKKNNVDVNYWDGDWTSYKVQNIGETIDVPAVPTVTPPDSNNKLTATLDNVKSNTTVVEFEIVKDNATVYKTAKATVVTGHVSYSCTVDSGSEYKVRARGWNGSKHSEWSEYSNNYKTVPSIPDGGITTIRAASKTSVYLEWGKSATAVSYDIEYSTKKEYFDNSDETTTKTGITNTHFEITGLTTGTEYFFRVRANLDNVGSSAWSEIKSVVIGSDPAAPTSWSSTTTAVIGEAITLYWVHNSADGSKETRAELEISIGGVLDTYTFADKAIDNSVLSYVPLSEEDKDLEKTRSCIIKTLKSDGTPQYTEGVVIKWRMRTAGITGVVGDWSVERTIDIYAQPTLNLRMTDPDGDAISVLTAFPFDISAVAGPKTQAPISYHLAITSNDVYETTDNVGNPKTINVGDQVYSRHFDTFEALNVPISANDVDLENNVEYTITCTVSMNSGLTASESLIFTVSWVDPEYEPNAEIGIDTNTYTASIRPYCQDVRSTIYIVEKNASEQYVPTAPAKGSVYGEPLEPQEGTRAYTDDGQMIYSGTHVYVNDASEEVVEDVLFCYVEDVFPVEDVMLSVYRREFDGSFTELATELDGAKPTTITDPHPSLDLARYRIVARDKNTGAISFYDPPGYPVGGESVIIQWDEYWSSFETSEEAALERPVWAGSMLKLPYNVDVSDTYQPEVELVNYIGRSHPVSYYGTHRGQTANWSMSIEKNDRETLYGLRRLANWMGDVYIREPSGSGYWANVKVSFSQTHNELTIPVTFEVTRVEGGA